MYLFSCNCVLSCYIGEPEEGYYDKKFKSEKNINSSTIVWSEKNYFKNNLYFFCE